MARTPQLSASLEDYLEAILHLVNEKRVARSRDIAERLKVNRSSVTGALQALGEKGLVEYEPYEAITLTRAGSAMAKDIVRRHETLRDFLVKVLSVELAEADEAACRMEHTVPPPVLDRLVQFLKFIQACPRAGAEWIKELGGCCEPGLPEACEPCIASLLEEVRGSKT